MPINLKVKQFKQDWVSHGINFIGIFVSVFLGFIVASYVNNERDSEQIEKLLTDFRTGSYSVLKKIEGTELYFADSRNSASYALDKWSVSTSNDFGFHLYRASQIITPPHELNFYSTAFQTDGISKIKEKNVRQQAAKFFSYNTDVFKLGALNSKYRDNIRSLLPHDYQNAFRTQCADIDDKKENSLGIRHAKNCIDNLPDISDELANALRNNAELRQNLNSYITQLLIIEQSLKDYRCNIIVFSNSISSDAKHHNILPSFCSDL